MFIGREKELNELNKLYNSNHNDIAIIYGRRRVGKTRLIQEFTKGKKTIFFSSQEGDSSSNLYNLSKEIAGTQVDFFPLFKSFKDALIAIGKKSEKEKTIFVIDEFQYLVNSIGKEIISILQNFIDNELEKSNLMIIISGSSVSFIENEVISSKNPLYGRAKLLIKLKPLSYYETGLWFSNYSSTDKAIMYGITGGVPMYLTCMDTSLSIKENLLNTIFNPNSILFSEPENMLRQEVREVKTYNSIIKAIANGKTKFNEIVDITCLNPGMVTTSINLLKELDIVEKLVPVGEKESYKKGYYAIKDLFFNFWYFFVPRNLSTIVSDRMNEYYDSLVTPYLNDYMGKIFERISIQYLLCKAKLPFPIKAIGAWWGNDKTSKKSIEIDIVAHSAIDDDVIIGSCKFRERAIDSDEYYLMLDYSKNIGHFSNAKFYFFSKNGFTEQMKRIENINLISIDDLYK